MTTKTPEEIVEQIQADISAKIEATGVCIMSVFPSENTPGFAYTIGLTALGLPEIIVFGLPPHYAHPALNMLFDAARTNPDRIEAGVLSGVFNMDVLLIDTDLEKASQYGIQAIEHYFPEYTPTFRQIVLPDVDGLYPWQNGYQNSFNQPVLGEPAEAPPSNKRVLH